MAPASDIWSQEVVLGAAFYSFSKSQLKPQSPAPIQKASESSLRNPYFVLASTTSSKPSLEQTKIDNSFKEGKLRIHNFVCDSILMLVAARMGE
ncbi:hypothetical protein ACE6H2_014865 [Prunus campanulata]